MERKILISPIVDACARQQNERIFHSFALFSVLSRHLAAARFVGVGKVGLQNQRFSQAGKSSDLNHEVLRNLTAKREDIS